MLAFKAGPQKNLRKDTGPKPKALCRLQHKRVTAANKTKGPMSQSQKAGEREPERALMIRTQRKLMSNR